ncbi:hypothetical protein [Parasitella parasitica]|uniref:Uncharacterized protein n=1 Tax=Parasitella parasitica TaxID=35722 RepID=A0A0B7NN01_9FUNG|nr:hypothetical protein [Parasitella parasitica]
MASGYMFYKARKPIVGIVLFQTLVGVAVTFVTLLSSLTTVDCTFLLLFSVVGVNVADICLQFVLLWKAFLGNNRSKIILCVGSIPLLLIAAFIIINMTFGRSLTEHGIGICNYEYPTYIVVAKAAIDCASNTFLSGCFVLVIYRHYRVLGSSIQKTLITEGLMYCFGVCLSNIVTGILLAKNVFGGSTPILYTIDWYLASYLIIKQLSDRYNSAALKKKKEDEEDDDDNNSSIVSKAEDEEEHVSAQGTNVYDAKERDTYYQSADSTLYVSSQVTTTHPSVVDVDEGKLHGLPTSSPQYETKY